MAERPWPFRRNIGLGGASRAGRCALHAAPTTGSPVLPCPLQPPRHSLGVSGPALPSPPLVLLVSDHPPAAGSAAETPDCSAPRTGVIFVLRPVRIKRNLTVCPSSDTSGPAATCRRAWPGWTHSARSSGFAKPASRGTTSTGTSVSPGPPARTSATASAAWTGVFPEAIPWLSSASTGSGGGGWTPSSASSPCGPGE